jgi:hypothetical protein
MFVVATFTCWSGCEWKMATVVVSAEAQQLEELLRKMSRHSCYFQTRPKGYVDLIVVEGNLARCELLPEVAPDGIKPLTLEEFEARWTSEDRGHRTLDRELKEERVTHTKKKRGSKR